MVAGLTDSGWRVTAVGVVTDGGRGGWATVVGGYLSAFCLVSVAEDFL